MTLQLNGEATAFFLYYLQVSMAMFGAKIQVQAHVPVVSDCGKSLFSLGVKTVSSVMLQTEGCRGQVSPDQLGCSLISLVIVTLS